MTAKQKAFCEHYIATLNGTEAARRAGYSINSARSIAAENLAKPYIRAYIDKVQEQLAKERIATADEILAYLSDTLRDAKETRRERTKAAELLGKRLNLFEADDTDENKESSFMVNIAVKDCRGGDGGDS